MRTCASWPITDKNNSHAARCRTKENARSPVFAWWTKTPASFRPKNTAVLQLGNLKQEKRGSRRPWRLVNDDPPPQKNLRPVCVLDEAANELGLDPGHGELPLPQHFFELRDLQARKNVVGGGVASRSSSRSATALL